MEIVNKLTALSAVQFRISYKDIDMYSLKNVHVQHTHPEYEIYVNLSGEISFLCGDTLYPVGPGNAVITRPNEAHHCVYRKNVSHKHYCLWFTCPPEEPLLDVFWHRAPGEGNLITLPEEESAEMLAICGRMVQRDKTSTLENGYDFARLLMLLNQEKTETSSATIPPGIQTALTRIARQVSGSFSIRELAEEAHMSLSTFERHFRTHVGMTPKQYITQRKLALAAEKLASGLSVSETFESCGFADYSHFIALFGKRFGMTPLAYRRARLENHLGDKVDRTP